MPHESIEENSNSPEIDEINDVTFRQEEEIEKDSRSRYEDFSAIAKLCIEVIKTAVTDSVLNLIPVVHAGKPGDPPEKPPKMKYTDLPLYKSPHYEYKDYLADKEKCPKANVKLLQEYLLPKVKDYRKGAQESYKELQTEYRAVKKDLCNVVTAKKNEFKNYMRDPENLLLRQAVVALGGAAGFYFGSGKGVSRRLFFTGLGVLATGALCFPKETDENFRNFTYHTANIGIAFFNKICGKQFSMRERLPSEDDMPPPPKPRKINPCDKK